MAILQLEVKGSMTSYVMKRLEVIGSHVKLAVQMSHEHFDSIIQSSDSSSIVSEVSRASPYIGANNVLRILCVQAPFPTQRSRRECASKCRKD